MDRVARLKLSTLTLAGALVACSSLLPACGGAPLSSEQMNPGDPHANAWNAVTSAQDPAQQRVALDAFLALERPEGARPLQVHVFRRDNGERAAIDQALWDHPGDHELELRLDGREYRFVPLSRASLEPLFRE